MNTKKNCKGIVAVAAALLVLVATAMGCCMERGEPEDASASTGGFDNDAGVSQPEEGGLPPSNQGQSDAGTEMVDAQADAPSPPPEQSINRVDGKLDILVVIDESSYQKDGHVFEGFSNVANADIQAVMDATAAQMDQMAGVQLVVTDILRVSFGSNLNPDEETNIHAFLDNLLTQSPKAAPEAVIFISKIGIAWLNGAYQSWHVVQQSAGYCNEFEVCYSNGASQQTIALAVMDWSHGFAKCGYSDETFPGDVRISDKPTQGECQNNPEAMCVLRSDGAYYQCEAFLGEPFSDLNVMRAFNVGHEILHAVDVNQYGHMGTPECNAALPGGLVWYDNHPDPNLFQEYFGMCPLVIEEFPQRFKGCQP